MNANQKVHLVVVTKDELIDKTDKAISELVYPKWELQKAYNYYNGIRDANQFRYLEERFGTSVPTTITFTPLIKKHIDAIIGEFLGTPIIPMIFCKDKETITNIDREKQLKIAEEIVKFLKSRLNNAILQIIKGESAKDTYIEQELQNIVTDINETFESEYEIAAQNIITYIMQSRDTDITNNLREIFLDLLVTGYGYFKVYSTPSNDNIRIKICSPLNTFVERNVESPYVKNSERAVVRQWLSKSQILAIYGDEMSEEDKKIIKEKWQSLYTNAMYYVRACTNDCIPRTDGILAGVEVTPGYPFNSEKYNELLPVYEVEWIETDKDNVMYRYETIRIGDEVYILRGKNENVIRSKSNPKFCTLSLNGVYLLNRNSEPYSLVLACTSEQDRYDLLHFYRDNIIANSGSIGDWIDMTLIPAHLGVNFEERLAKWISLKKQGIALLDSSSEGRLASGQAPINTIFNGYDDTVKVQAIQAIQLAIEATEKTVSSITGVFRERLDGIDARDAVTNVKIGQNNSFISTKQYNHQMDLVVNELLLDCLNLSKSVYKNGLTGTYILGDKYQKIFTARAEHFTLTDYDIRVITSSDIVRDLEQVKQIVPEFVKSGNLPADLIIDALTSKSLPDLKRKIRKALKQQKEENNQIAQLTQQIEQLTEQLKQSSEQLQQAETKIQNLNQAKLELEQQSNQTKYQIEWYKAQTDRTFKEKQAEEAKRRTDIEARQLYDGNPYNDKVNMSSGL